MTTRFKCTDYLQNVAYIHERDGRWRCTLDNGLPAAMFYAVGNCDEMALKFALEDAKNDDARLKIIQRIAGPRRAVVMV